MGNQVHYTLQLLLQLSGTKGCLCIVPLEDGKEGASVEFEFEVQGKSVLVTIIGSIDPLKITESFRVEGNTAVGEIRLHQ